MDNWDMEEGYQHPELPDGVEDRRASAPLDYRVSHLKASHEILKAKVGDHEKIITDLKDATQQNTKAINGTKDAVTEVKNAIKDAVKTAKTVLYVGLAFFLLNFYGWETVLKGLTGIGK